MSTRPALVRWRAPAVGHGEPAQLRPLGYLPALDGIRALAVIAVFVFHAGFGWASGGFLGVSVFFTLSGYLITRLLLDGVLATKAVDLLRFWSRRIRRLLPAALLTVALVLLLAATVLKVTPDDIRSDTLATIGYVANWHFLFGGQSYQALFTEPSPLLHFWSLAIEEQFYLVYPIVLALVVGVGGGRRVRIRLRTVLLVGIGLSLMATMLAVRAGDGDFVYYSTPTRAAELLTGALLGCSLAGTTLVGADRRRWALPVGAGALAAIAVLCAITTRSTEWLTNGGLPVFSLLSVALVAAALPRGPFASALGVAPLRGLGKISYGVYLYHWPVILWLDESQVGLSGAVLAGVRAAVTLAIAIVSYALIEQPIRTGRFPRGAIARIAPAGAIAAACALAVFVTSTMHAPEGFDLQATKDRLTQLARSNRTEPARPNEGRSSLPSVPSAPAWDTTAPPPRVDVFGDSNALADGYGLGVWGRETGALQLMGGDYGFGCSVARGGLVRVMDREPGSPMSGGCGDWAVDWPRAIALDNPEVAVIFDGAVEMADRLLPGDTQWRAIGDPLIDAYFKSEMLAATDLLLSRGMKVVWVTTLRIDIGRDLPYAHPEFPENRPERVVRFNRLIAEVAAERPGVIIADLRSWVRDQPGGELDWDKRPDGVHFTADASVWMSGWLGPTILSAVRPLPA